MVKLFESILVGISTILAVIIFMSVTITTTLIVIYPINYILRSIL